MPDLALLLVAIWFLVVFVIRTALQWWRTGSTGLKGFHGTPGSLPWVAGVMVSVGFVLALGAPLAAVMQWPGGTLLFQSTLVHWTGAVLLTMGTIGTLAAQLSMGESWRVGVDEGEETQLVTTGLFAWVRNPIFSFMGLSQLGLVLLIPIPVALLGAILSIVGVVLQVRFVEEPYLQETHGAEYREYTARVGRFIPGVGRIESSILQAGQPADG